MSTNPAEAPVPDPSSAPEPAQQVSEVEDKRYAVYDLRHLKFVGPVTAKKPTAAQAKKFVGHDDVEVREV